MFLVDKERIRFEQELFSSIHQIRYPSVLLGERIFRYDENEMRICVKNDEIDIFFEKND